MGKWAFLAALVLAPVWVAAHSDHDKDAIEARRAYFKLIGANMAELGAMAKGEVAYDAETAALHAGNLAALASYNAAPHFPEGTSNRDQPGKTRALIDIWLDGPDFGVKWQAFTGAVDLLQTQADRGRDPMAAAVGKLGGTCKGCHDTFRAKDF